MNERLKEEIELWKHKRCSYDEHGDISATAQHFYSLALEDVKNEVEKEKMNNVKDFSNGCDEDQCYGFDLALKHIEVFIDQLSK